MQKIWDFIIAEPGAASVVAMVGIAAIGGAWVLYRHFFPGTENGSGPSTDVAEITKTSQEGHRLQLEDAVAARHLGALAFADDTDKALAAYRKAVDLDPENADGWIQLGHLLRRTGDLDGAERAYGRVLSLGNLADDDESIAIATGNLGTIYNTRGHLDRAEEMYRKSLEIEEALGRKEGMAKWYGNLGNVYQTRGDLDRAEKMYRKSLKIEEAFGRKQGMASDYGNLGTLYQTRGDLDRAEEMYRKSLALFREVGAAPRVEHIKSLLSKLRIERR